MLTLIIIIIIIIIIQIVKLSAFISDTVILKLERLPAMRTASSAIN